MMEPTPIRGIWCASVTPLRKDGGIDHGKMAGHLGDLLGGRGVDGVALFGTMGEGPSLSVVERMAGLEALLFAGIPPSRLLVSTGCAAFTDTVVLTRHALEFGCPRCLIMPPFFWKGLPEEAVFRYYASLIDTIANPRLRIYLYHYPQLSGVSILPETAARLAEIYPGVVAGMKDSGGDFEYTIELLKSVPQLSILTGHELNLPRLLRAGGAGTVCGIPNLFPDLVAGLLKSDVDPADEARVRTVLEIIETYPFLPAIKAVRAVQTHDPAWRALRLPLLPLAEDACETLLAALDRAGFGIAAGAAR